MKSKSSVRSFGILFFIVFFLLGVWPLLNDSPLRLWSITVSIIFLFLGLIKSKLLIPFNIYWIKFGEFLGKIIAPIVMLGVYIIVLTPIGIILKIFRKDILSLKIDKKLNSYWRKREFKILFKKQF